VAQVKQPKRTPRGAFIDALMTGACCGQDMDTGYDTLQHECRLNDYVADDVNCYYAECTRCGNIEVLCDKCVDDAVARELEYWTREARNSRFSQRAAR
jgi:hypothetical protein